MKFIESIFFLNFSFSTDIVSEGREFRFTQQKISKNTNYYSKKKN